MVSTIALHASAVAKLINVPASPLTNTPHPDRLTRTLMPKPTAAPKRS